ncbi:MAG: hypothetical protein IJU95_07060 [Treponema sp.]|nr:hypothetical protein [Treponema sp.]
MSQFVEDGWHGGSTATTSSAPTVDDRVVAPDTTGLYGELRDALVESLRNAPSASTAAKGDTAKALVGNSETMDKNAANAFFNDTIKEANEKINNASSDEEKARLQKELEEKLEAERQKWAELLNALNSSQNEINTITQVISTSEKVYDSGKKNYEESEDKITSKTKELSDNEKAWQEAKGWMSDLQNAQDALSAAKEKLLNAMSEEERKKAQAELDAEREKWQALLDKVLEYSEKEIEAAKKLGDKKLEKEWTEQHDLLASEGNAVNKSLDSISSNMNDYFNKLNADGTRNSDYRIAADLADAQYIEAAAALKATLEDMKDLQSALIAYARYVLEEAQKLLELSKGDLNMSLDQAEKAFNLAKVARDNAAMVYEDAKGTPYEENAKVLVDAADKIVNDAYDNLQKIRDYLQNKNLSTYSDDEFIDKRLKDAEDYAKSLGYLYSVNWLRHKGDKVIDSFTDLEALGVKENTYYKAVGKIDNGTLFLGEDIRFYKVERKDVFCSSAAASILLGRTEDSGGGGNNFSGRRCYVSAEVYGDCLYYVVEVNGDVYVQGIKYANCYLKNYKVSEQACYGGREQSQTANGIYGEARRLYPDSSFCSALSSQWGGLQPNGSFSDGFSIKIFSKSFLGY